MLIEHGGEKGRRSRLLKTGGWVNHMSHQAQSFDSQVGVRTTPTACAATVQSSTPSTSYCDPAVDEKQVLDLSSRPLCPVGVSNPNVSISRALTEAVPIDGWMKPAGRLGNGGVRLHKSPQRVHSAAVKPPMRTLLHM